LLPLAAEAVAKVAAVQEDIVLQLLQKALAEEHLQKTHFS
jgi:hypothetical protein